uniref:Uncharacterized protein n=1 Tax=Amphimedon queenslandica TaxID=400682 RepID=A0A1X7UYU9_AMPQE
MKLNPISALLPVSLPQFNTIHPYVPSNQTTGYHGYHEPHGSSRASYLGVCRIYQRADIHVQILAFILCANLFFLYAINVLLVKSFLIIIIMNFSCCTHTIW